MTHFNYFHTKWPFKNQKWLAFIFYNIGINWIINVFVVWCWWLWSCIWSRINGKSTVKITAWNLCVNHNKRVGAASNHYNALIIKETWILGSPNGVWRMDFHYVKWCYELDRFVFFFRILMHKFVSHLMYFKVYHLFNSFFVNFSIQFHQWFRYK